MKMSSAFAAMLSMLLAATSAPAAFLIEPDIDGLDDTVLTFSPNFSFGGDTSTASQSIAATSFGLTGGDSLFGGDGSAFLDTYVYTYDPSSEADNLVLPAGTQLGDGDVGLGNVGGGPGTYRVYATWPFTENVSGGLTTYDVTTSGDSFSTPLDQNGRGHVWVLLGEIDYTSGPITVSQQAGENTFVSMRSAGVMFELIPEPTSLALFGLGTLSLALTRRRS